jgi:hypothetical protein
MLKGRLSGVSIFRLFEDLGNMRYLNQVLPVVCDFCPKEVRASTALTWDNPEPVYSYSNHHRGLFEPLILLPSIGG